MIVPLALIAASPSLAPSILVVGQRTSFAKRSVPDEQLASMRGGIRLPNGLTLALGIDIQTRIDGVLALHTVYASDGANPGIRVYTDGTKPVSLAPTNASITSGAVPGIPLLVVDRSPSGTTIVPTGAANATTVNLVTGDPSTWLSGDGQSQIPVVANGGVVAAPPGNVSLATGPLGAVVTLSTPTVEVRQLIGQATGVVVLNTGNDRVIDTVSSVNVDLRGFSAPLLAGTFIAQRAALDALLPR
jgi:hypothetical protein